MITALSKAWQGLTARFQRWSENPWFYPVGLLLIGLISYGYSLRSLGYYWDDWEVVFLLHARQLSLLYGYFAFDRPFAWPYQLMYSIFGLNAAAWHLMTLVLRWAGVLFFYLSLRLAWPRFDSYLRWIGVLILVYPGFLQQSISAAYNRHFAAFALSALSLFLMALAIRNQRRGWILWPLSWLAGAIQVITIEYFVGLEIARLILLWVLIGQTEHPSRIRRLGRTVLLGSPYLLVFAGYFWWRLLVFPQSLARLNYTGDFKFLQDFSGSLLAGILALLNRGVFDLVYSTIQVWFAALTGPGAFTFQGKAAWFALGLGSVVAFIFSSVQPRPRASSDEAQDGSPRSLFLFGLAVFILSGLPIWITSRQLTGGGRWDDRFSLAMMLGAVIMITVLIMWLVRDRWQRPVLGLLLALSISTQVLIVNRYRLEWALENAYFWQLAWRVPALEPQTAIFSLEQPSASVPGYDASFALNVLFNGKVADGTVPYWFFTNDRFLNFAFVPGKSIAYKDRNLRFTGSTSEAISVLHQGQDRCLQVLDADYASQPFYGAGQAQLVAVSNVSRILSDPVSAPDPGIFGPEPPHTWCYYFEKADLARQARDWTLILQLDRQARQDGYFPRFGVEYIPFIQAYAQTGDWRKALELSRAAQALTTQMDPLLCATWSSLGGLPSADAGVLAEARRSFACSTP